MRVVGLVVCVSAVVARFALGQSTTPTRIYFYSPTGLSVTTTLDLDKPILISQYTLLELASDSVGVRVNAEKVVFFHFGTLKSHYYRVSNNPTGRLSLSPLRRDTFWGLTQGRKAGTYRMYTWDKNHGLVLAVEKQ